MTKKADFSFDPIAAKYLALRPRDMDWWIIYNRLAQEVKLKSTSTVLDLGCGPGPMSMALLETTDNVFARDPSKEMIEQTLFNTESRAIATQGQADYLPYPDGYFDAIVTWLSIHFWSNLKSFNEVYRALTPGGSFGIVSFSQEHFKTHWLGEYFPHIPTMELARFLPAADLSKLLAACGFKDIRVIDLPLKEEVTRNDALARVRAKYVSPLHLISDEEYTSGLMRMEKEFPDKIVRVMGWQLIIAQK